MDLVEDKPRQQPKPVPFCQSALLQPTVPEVSLLLQEDQKANSNYKGDSFSGTEFQTYNSWRWNYLNQNNSKTSSSEPNKGSKATNYLLKDKYHASDIEKRKNEILYGELDEPRRPLPPRTSPVIPISIEPFFSDSPFYDLKSVEKQRKAQSPTYQHDKTLLPSYSNQMCLKKEIDNSEKLYGIISEQNKQMQVLQNQIEQLLKLQDVKDKQIEQLLKSQESKEKKIEQLLLSLDSKDKEILEFIKTKENQEQYLQELLKSQENIQKENNNLLKKLNESKKGSSSVGVMAFVQVSDAVTCTSCDGVLNNCRNTENTIGGNSVLRESIRIDERDKSLSLHSSDLPVIQESVPSPQSSIHVDIQDFPDSSDDSESESGIPRDSFSTSQTQATPLGHTFYNNVLTQLKGIIQHSGEKENKDKSERHSKKESNVIIKNSVAPEESVHARNVFEEGNLSVTVKNQERVESEPYRFPDKFQNLCLKDTSSPSDISLKINALAMKYLKEEQISEFGLQTQIPTPCQHDVTIYNVTNLSFGSMRYLDRYQMLPKVKDNPIQVVNAHKGEHSPGEFLRRRKRMTIEENITSIGNILDMSTLNHQPKLL